MVYPSPVNVVSVTAGVGEGAGAVVGAVVGVGGVVLTAPPPQAVSRKQNTRMPQIENVLRVTEFFIMNNYLKFSKTIYANIAINGLCRHERSFCASTHASIAVI